MIRPANTKDLQAIAAIYEAIHTEEEAGRMTIGWARGVYPTLSTAQAALTAGDLFVCELDGQIVAAARINQEQVDVYAKAPWQYEAAPEQVMVLHTLVVAPQHAGRGIGKAFAAFYEEYALAHGCPCLRIDTNARNLTARALYRKLGYREAAILPCRFNNIPGVQLVCLEKWLGD